MWYRLALFVILLSGGPALAGNITIDVYSGLTATSDSDVTGVAPGASGGFGFATVWKDTSLSDLPYVGGRVTWAMTENGGVAVDISRLKITAARTNPPVTRLSLLRGIDTLTVNWMQSFPNATLGKWEPYAGLGLGLARVGAEVDTTSGNSSIRQTTGPAATGIVGLRRALSPSASIFAEYKLQAIDLDLDLEAGGSLETSLVTHALNVGLGISF